MRMIFVNLPVKDLTASKAFFANLGFSFEPKFTDSSAACMVVEQNIFVMLITEARFRDFIVNDISDAAKTTEVLLCISAENRKAVDTMLVTALKNGGKRWKPAMDYGNMYGCSFQDLDGHVWEIMWMEEPANAATVP